MVVQNALPIGNDHVGRCLWLAFNGVASERGRRQEFYKYSNTVLLILAVHIEFRQTRKLDDVL